MVTVVTALAGLKIDKADIQTSNYSIYPNYSYANNVSAITGYNGSVNLTIKVRDPKLAAQVISTVTNAGATGLGGADATIEQGSQTLTSVVTPYFEKE